tara:strand:+ start:894 stop:2303 length:1410 start_codon:yes stop_codon:yes gene_type:complete
MIIGKLDRKLKLFTQTFSTNAYGERVVSDNSFVTIYGDFDFKSGNTTYDADDLINSQTIECLIRYRTNIGTTPQYFIQNGSTNYSIKAIKQVGNRKDAMILTLEKNDVVDLSTVAPNQFVFTIDTANLSDGSTLNTQFKLPTVASGSYNCTVLWGDGSSDTITSYNQAEVRHTYTSAGEYQISIEGTIQGWQFNNTQDRLKILNISNYGALNISTNKAFFGCSNLEANATDYPTISTDSLESMFEGCTNFDGVVDEWNVSGVYFFDKMFKDCFSFDQPLNSWNTENSGSYVSMFENCITFNQDLSNWQVEAVIDMSRMFYNCVQFNGEISSWAVQDTENMSEMLFNCDRFDQSLAGWKVNFVTNFTNFMQNASGLSTKSYSNTLIAWAILTVQPNININFGGSQYEFEAFSSKQSLIEDDNWTIVDGGLFNPTPAQFISVLNTRVIAAGGVMENTTDSQAFLQELNDIS